MVPAWNVQTAPVFYADDKTPQALFRTTNRAQMNFKIGVEEEQPWIGRITNVRVGCTAKAATTLLERGRALFDRGHVARARRCFDAAIAVRTRLNGPRHP